MKGKENHPKDLLQAFFSSASIVKSFQLLAESRTFSYKAKENKNNFIH